MSESTNKAVFLSYASQDAEAARHIAESLRASGVEVWFDVEGGLEHGDEWDAKIRRQFKECVLFIPLISANTQARHEGYFRLEWDMAAERARSIASGVAFILPVVVDDTREPEALVPDRFRAVQWTRLPGGIVPPDVQARFLKLWSHRTGVVSHQAEVGAPLAGARGRRQAAPLLDKPRSWLVPGILGVLAIAALAIWQPWHRSESDLFSPSDAPVSETQRLLAQAWDLLNKPEMARAELDAADRLCQRAEDLESTNADVWATWSYVNTWYVFHGLDDTAARREAAQDYATRARQLARHSFEARLAQAFYWTRGKTGAGNAQRAEAEALLRELLTERPDEPRTLFTLGFLLLLKGSPLEGLELLERLARNPDWAAVAWDEIGWAYFFQGRFEAVAKAAEQSISARPYWNNLALKIALACDWSGDLALARSTLEQMPSTALQEDWGTSVAYEVFTLRREPLEGLRTLQSLPRQWLRSNYYEGPKTFLTGKLRLMAGQTETARRDFLRALELIEQHLVEAPNRAELLELKAEAHLRLGNQSEAESAYRQLKEIRPLPGLAVQILFEPADVVIDRLEQRFDHPSWGTTAARFRLDPMYDPLREHPRFQALLARAEVSSTHTPNPKVTAAPTTAAKSVPAEKSVAVLAFANLSDDKDNEYFSDGISEELLNVLAKIPGLKVTARTSSFFFKGRNVPIADIAQQLGVAYVVEGSVRKQGDRVRISAQLIKAADGFNVWSDKFDRDLKDIFAVQDEIAGLIANNLQLKLGAGAATMVNAEAFQLYLQGRQAWNQRTPEGLARAVQLATQAIALEPNFARAHAALSDALLLHGEFSEAGGGTFGWRNSRTIGRAREIAERAVALDPASAEVRASLGLLHLESWHYDAAVRELKQAVALNPNYATAHQWLGDALIIMDGRMDEGLASLAHAVELDPLSHRILDTYANQLNNSGRPVLALAAADRALALQPEAIQARIQRARALVKLGRLDEAAAIARPIAAPDSRYLASGVLLLALAGQEAEAERALAQADGNADPQMKFYGNLALGRTEAALQAMDPNNFWGQETPMILFDPVFDPIRADARFVQALATLGLTESHARAQAWRAAHPPAPQ